ncbi:DUF4917 family protein [Bacillus sp. L381]|uniref:DUF4917 family protein n=1 Tax=Bacillus TaxID=1386 RepID=UPI001BA65D74|nr:MULTISPECIES: DUF4917 family protein [Bacillus]MCR9040969.1 DUF4917 family protein [Bacillus velezensis]QUN07949.1 DUF4917 family protein [Bacillus amyloliquefaciens]QYM81015.1 DUF4917 family protein [Bacillus sp. 7D3]QZY10162.1 DUF4917 family protein [Bacillus amyloliquefaciens]QZY11072.1 DUF4917 family protein [Bacillus amyloliquefaciens]
MNTFEDIVRAHPEVLDNFLYGNGFSQAINRDFGYTGLYEKIKDELTLADRELFETVLNTTNFEMVLNSLLKTEAVNNAYQISSAHLHESYRNIKNLLIKAVKNMHPPHGDVNQEKIAWIFSMFNHNIFTTNYDLLTYWGCAPMFKNKLVSDGFTRRYETLTFSEDAFVTNRLRVFYLHGALHFYEESGDVVKTESFGSDLLMTITGQYEKKKFPLYVSEGTSHKKLAQIKQNPYLSHCYTSLKHISGGLTIFGQDLNKEFDGHLIEAVSDSNAEYIAYGVYETEHNTAADIKYKIDKLFRDTGKTLLFFRSTSFFEFASEKANSKVPQLLRKKGGFPFFVLRL